MSKFLNRPSRRSPTRPKGGAGTPAVGALAESVRVLDSTTLLAAWEQGAAQSPLARALTLLAAAHPDQPAAWAQASIGERDRELLRLRESLFGTDLEAVAVCPQCGERLELSFATHDILIPALPAPEVSRTVRVAAAGYEILCHAPTSEDLAAAPDRAALLERCVELAKLGAEVIAPAALPEAAVAAVEAALAGADPQADVKLALSCPACSHQWQSIFDIAAFLWGEIDDWAQRLLLDVHLLASTYGWSERDIVAMTPRRRGMYLEMAGAA